MNRKKSIRLQNLNRSSIVISSGVSIKLRQISVQTQTNGTITKQVLVSTNKTSVISSDSPATTMRALSPPGSPVIINSKPTFLQRLAINVSLNLVEVNSENASFNKSIDGGIGMGCYLNEFT